jgi:copper transport protein
MGLSLLSPLLAICSIAATAPAFAHSELTSSAPASGAKFDAPPAAIELVFNERVQITALRLFREGGAEVALPRPRAAESVTRLTTPLPPLPAGSYRADWRIISADGHPVGGVIRFSVAAP